MGGTTDELALLLGELPGPLALFDEGGALIHANDGFVSAAGSGPVESFSALFGDAPETIAERREATVLGGRHWGVALRRVVGSGWVCQLHDVSPWVEHRALAEDAATRDTLTGLPNRGRLMPELERALADPERTSALLLIDLDRFKAVNDTLGHSVGDALLAKVAQRLCASLRPTDTVSRLGGDEFAVLQPGGAQPGSAEQLAKRLVELLGRPYLLDGHMVDIGASIGVAIAGDDATTETLLKQADIALYRAKANGRGHYCFFEQQMDEEMQERRALELDLRRALAFRQFELNYQPQFDLATQSVSGLEALLRWHHPERGLVSPADFIPLAEETGLIIPIGEWVIRQACADAATWPSDVAVAVNVSAKQLASGKLLGTVAHALAQTGLTPARFEVEITESVLMSDIEGCVETLHRLRDLGVHVSMDDFGTGYSSLSYLASFPFDKIKIDGSFVRNGDREKSDGILRAIAAIGRHLGMTTIAEGVETDAQFADVASSGCGSVQGFLISRPVPASELEALFARMETGPVQQVPMAADVAPVVPAAFEPDEQVYRLVYYSHNAIMGVEEEVRASVDRILKTSQANNARIGVTGALMFTDGFFAQVLEGTREAVETVFERIQLDDRHQEVQLLSFAPAGARLFAGWSMAWVGAAGPSHAMFGTFASASGFDANAIDGDMMCRQLRTMLEEEERFDRAA